jgi:glutamate formiminotransferase
VTNPGCLVADYSSDIDHNVFISILGARKAYKASLGFLNCLLNIDIPSHGEHPRIGAVDFIPFTPWELQLWKIVLF